LSTTKTHEIKIRFNTDKDKVNAALRPWRVIIDGEEHLAENVTMTAGSWTTYDEIKPGLWKWHITCRGHVEWDHEGKNCVVR